MSAPTSGQGGPANPPAGANKDAINADYHPYLINADFLLVDKAPDSNLHRNSHSHSLLDRLKVDFQQQELFPVHRLDDATSGLLIVARHRAAAAELGRLFEARQVEKYYVAIADGKPRKKQGAVQGDLIKSRGGSYRLSRGQIRPSKTHFLSFSLAPGRRLYLLRPYTGKTHQLRVVMKSLGVPILGDKRYGPAGASEERLYLHAYGLRFRYGGQNFSICQPPRSGAVFQDGALQRALVELGDPWSLSWPDPP